MYRYNVQPKNKKNGFQKAIPNHTILAGRKKGQGQRGKGSEHSVIGGSVQIAVTRF